MRTTLLAACLASAVFAAGPALAAGPHAHQHRHADDSDAATAGLPPAPTGLMRTLEDEKRPSGPDRIAWSTYWKLCWQAVAGAQHYDVRLVTSEGAPRTPRPTTDTCHRVEAAAGENAIDEGLPQRDLMLAMQAAQAAVQIRAVFGDGRRTAWTAEQAIGDVARRGD